MGSNNNRDNTSNRDKVSGGDKASNRDRASDRDKAEREHLDVFTSVHKRILNGIYDDFFGNAGSEGSGKAENNADRRDETGKRKTEGKSSTVGKVGSAGKSGSAGKVGSAGTSGSAGKVGSTGTSGSTVTSGSISDGLAGKGNEKGGNGTVSRDEAPVLDMQSSYDDAIKGARDALLEARRIIEEDGLGLGTSGTLGMPVAYDGGAQEASPAAAATPSEPEEDPAMIRKEKGLKSVPVSMHLVFTGNPGTGKTTVARILAKIYKNIGVLSKGQLVEVDRSGLVAGYVGQTALKTQDVIRSALGGVLFIDEAYALSQKDDNFGQEAIDTILKAMEDHRDDFIVIVAGYTKPMEKFINSNPGLKSRFNKYIEFPDYSIEELEKIFYMNCDKYDYKVADDAKGAIKAMILTRKLNNPINFANARDVRNMFEDIITNQARRVVKMQDPKPEDICMICLDDLTEDGASEESEGKDGKQEDGASEESERKDSKQGDSASEESERKDGKQEDDASEESV